jgi:hypothetical protein
VNAGGAETIGPAKTFKAAGSAGFAAVEVLLKIDTTDKLCAS